MLDIYIIYIYIFFFLQMSINILLKPELFSKAYRPKNMAACLLTSSIFWQSLQTFHCSLCAHECTWSECYKAFDPWWSAGHVSQFWCSNLFFLLARLSPPYNIWYMLTFGMRRTQTSDESKVTVGREGQNHPFKLKCCQIQHSSMLSATADM